MWTEITRPQYERPDLRYASDLTNTERELYSLATHDGFSRNADAQHVAMAITDMQGLLRGKYVSRNKLLLLLESGWGVAPLTLALDPDDMIMKAPGIVDGSDGFADASNGIP